MAFQISHFQHHQYIFYFYYYGQKINHSYIMAINWQNKRKSFPSSSLK